MTDADKRDRIIAAAYDVLSKQGYDKASTKEIASTAGVAQGLINYYFPSKDQLFAEVFRRETERYCESFDGVIDVKRKEPLTMTSIAELLEVPKNRALEEPEWFRLRYELFAIGLRNDAARPILKEMLEIKTEHIAQMVQPLTGFPIEQSRTLAAILHAIIEGLALQKIADPDFKYDEAYAMLSQMLGAHYASVSGKRED
ncbi:TetR/AcrR family transcriptional regulator [Cohnella yongneupensis]|uniref:TetR/AcrR family transcriptional regulator n=1 Tax=Cohnella yongneupensis TaxID=425006 RepID=A0ABW0QWC0_9BACL